MCVSGISLAQCTSVQSRQDTALSKINASSSYKSRLIETRHFSLFTAAPVFSKNHPKALKVVIEGDGLAWDNRYTPSDNPTPLKPIGLDIAIDLQAVYLARPCQYVWDAVCKEQYWTDQRFSFEVIKAYQDALNTLKQEYQIEQFSLIGYSGGAYIALILAATRNDITHVDTIAGLLDPSAWTEFHNITPLSLEYSSQEILDNSAQTTFKHVCGMKDEIIPCSLTEGFISKAQKNGLKNHTLYEVPNASHDNIWLKFKKNVSLRAHFDDPKYQK